MASLTLSPAPFLGADINLGANRIRERDDLALVAVAIPQGGEAALVKALSAVWELAMPEPKQSTQSQDMRALRMTPDQIMLVFPHTGADEETVVAKSIGDAGYVTMQTDAWVRLEISGPDTHTALERICPLDLHATSFPIGAAARTVMEHMSAVIVRTDEDRYLLMSASSSAGSFLHAVETSYKNVLA